MIPQVNAATPLVPPSAPDARPDVETEGDTFEDLFSLEEMLDPILPVLPPGQLAATASTLPDGGDLASLPTRSLPAATGIPVVAPHATTSPPAPEVPPNQPVASAPPLAAPPQTHVRSAESAVLLRATAADAGPLSAATESMPDPAGPPVVPPPVFLVEPPPETAPAKPGRPSSMVAPLPSTVLPSLLHDIRQASADTVELTLNPEDLGRLRFELTRTGDQMIITLTVERPETLDLMRRHADSLLAEFRQAGYVGASLSFGHWGQGGHSQSPAQRAPSADPEPSIPPQQTPAAPSAPEGVGLDLRL